MTNHFASHHHQLADDRQRDYLTRAERARQARRARRQASPVSAVDPASSPTGVRAPLRLVRPFEPCPGPNPSAA